RHPFFPNPVATLERGEDFPGLIGHHVRVGAVEVNDVFLRDEMAPKELDRVAYMEVVDGEQLLRLTPLVEHGVHIQPRIAREELTKGLKNAAFHAAVVRLIENIEDICHTQDNANLALGVAVQIGPQPEETQVVRYQHVESECAQ